MKKIILAMIVILLICLYSPKEQYTATLVFIESNRPSEIRKHFIYDFKRTGKHHVTYVIN